MINIDGIEGVDFINVSNNTTHNLGRQLNTYYVKQFDTVAGKCNRIQNFLDFIKRPGLSYTYLLTTDFRAPELRKYKSIDIKNYWAIVAYIVYERLKQDPGLIAEIKENSLPYVAIKVIEKNTIVGKTLIKTKIEKLEPYIKIINKYSQLIKENNFTEEECKKVIMSYSHSDNIFEGTVIKVQ